MADAKEVLKVRATGCVKQPSSAHTPAQIAVEGSVAHCGAVFDAAGTQLMTCAFLPATRALFE